MRLCEWAPERLPMPLLLEADPCEAAVRRYLANGRAFVARQGETVLAACVLQPKGEGVVELMNVAVLPERQGQGIGTELLRYVIDQLAQQGMVRIELGTGTFGYQLTFYQRLGFRVDSVVKDHFLNNYDEPIFEHGIQHQDMLRLVLLL
ncbi:GNAT family N-acetyltransferase [Ferrimonas pelagia]|uniref:GNAT family N-acetyltransferase n=1 Tax=Ferrimonas pelagia TaxID=1177826 RepID=A0ABP9F8V9_9GAMM